ncbi:RNA pseudouridine synthase 7 isoform X2 [Nicotiana tabacum]|uniref:RNA pseudouridine synthase 7 isoform X2 n=2 Tax=Nicotiana TaxID=4085 RepID=A0A1S3ZSE3_TOBAC|nr:PREDICTED: RNA pseudouridine synthase 7 isoform X2 [Nicotiana sylvestris]XP_016467331.1 PREDICTED: RNA pseudouridine synthase 7-like isoform X2 [Nicotiana tabacum]
MNMKRKRGDMEIVWQTPANPPERHDYIFRNGIRYVRPYYFEFISHVKNRWAGKTIVDLFSEEFKGRPRDYYESAVKSGRIQVDGQKVHLSYVVQSSQKISHFLHRHEPPVMSWDVEILCEEPDVLTVCKPASVPVHPCGQYRKNTVVGILQAEYGLAPLFPPIFLFCSDFSEEYPLSSSFTAKLIFYMVGVEDCKHMRSQTNVFQTQEIESGAVQKQYIARVIGVFPDKQQVVNANVNYNAREGRSTVEVGDDQGNSTASLKGKTACTKFTRISTNEKHSIVLCEPVTGRTHQIRVHLQYTGHPIANDMLYLSELVSSRSAEGSSADRAAAKSCSPPEPISLENGISDTANDSNEDFSIDPMCTNCPNLAPKGYEGNEEGLWLHCVKYSGPDWIYECPLPDWASLS